MTVMAGLVPAIHVFGASKKQDVDARHEAGHDESRRLAAGALSAICAYIRPQHRKKLFRE
jgi:hypothetical protein